MFLTIFGNDKHTFRLEEINFGDCLLKTKGAVLLGEALQDGHLCLEVGKIGVSFPSEQITIHLSFFSISNR